MYCLLLIPRTIFWHYKSLYIKGGVFKGVVKKGGRGLKKARPIRGENVEGVSKDLYKIFL